VIPRLWLCTWHPALQISTLPLHPLVILALVVAAWLMDSRSDVWALLLRRLWMSLCLATIGGFVLIALPGWVVVKIGGNGNPIFVAARYLWVALAWAAVGAGTAWAVRGAAAPAGGSTESVSGNGSAGLRCARRFGCNRGPCVHLRCIYSVELPLQNW